ncbi:M23 family metallopeptidase [Anaplasma platys]|uniref:M23 family metallopeptidase n=1 Tax=Anaplasma platys TaxID=949 RepID=A0A858PXK3_9RICK|nr:M23 family metallopeptidase [Anaplasma platys]QJC27309.1 M23 family metallopeptidase [Anaplasma platys]
MIYELQSKKQTNVRTVGFAACLLLLAGCLTQNPAPVLLRGEEFYGTKEADPRYRVVRDRGGPATAGSKTRQGKVIVGDIYSTDTPSLAKEHVRCDFEMPLDSEVLASQRFTSTAGANCGDGAAIVVDVPTQAVASSGGKVLYIGKGLQDYGNMVILEHDKYTITMYHHLDEISVKIGDTVFVGGALGTTSTVSGHVQNQKGHFFCFAMKHNGKSVDPLRHIKECRKGKYK